MSELPASHQKVEAAKLQFTYPSKPPSVLLVLYVYMPLTPICNKCAWPLLLPTTTLTHCTGSTQAVELFLEDKIKYLDIAAAVENTCDAHRQELVDQPSLEEIVHFDGWARQLVSSKYGAREPALA